ncbi:helix-turn-helix domain-containing protein [Citromicrobium bathyomarinum]|uniref:helix-turn-helix domain-containing protein n=1 Tax=Citromicrobium bathyomarinum TaxID=72174 RepID=UPI00315AAAD3
MTGRPTEYDSAHCAIARELAANGATNPEIARELGVSARTIGRWTVKHPEFAEALRVGKEPADDRVVSALYNRALGYDIEEEKVGFFDGKPVVATITKHIPADVNAQRLWLTNRRRDEWGNRMSVEVEDTDAIANAIAAGNRRVEQAQAGEPENDPEDIREEGRRMRATLEDSKGD